MLSYLDFVVVLFDLALSFSEQTPHAAGKCSYSYCVTDIFPFTRIVQQNVTDILSPIEVMGQIVLMDVASNDSRDEEERDDCKGD